MTFMKTECKRKGRKRLTEELKKPASSLLSVEPPLGQRTAPEPRAGSGSTGVRAGLSWEPRGPAGTPPAATQTHRMGQATRHEVIGSNLSAQAEPSRSTGHSPVSRRFLSLSREETPQPLWPICSRARSPAR